MIKIIQTNDKSLPRKQEGWRNSTAALKSTVAASTNCQSTISDDEVDLISKQVDDTNCNKCVNNDVRQFEINNYIQNFVKQNGSIIKKVDENKENNKLILG